MVVVVRVGREGGLGGVQGNCSAMNDFCETHEERTKTINCNNCNDCNNCNNCYNHNNRSIDSVMIASALAIAITNAPPPLISFNYRHQLAPIMQISSFPLLLLLPPTPPGASFSLFLALAMIDEESKPNCDTFHIGSKRDVSNINILTTSPFDSSFDSSFACYSIDHYGRDMPPFHISARRSSIFGPAMGPALETGPPRATERRSVQAIEKRLINGGRLETDASSLATSQHLRHQVPAIKINAAPLSGSPAINGKGNADDQKSNKHGPAFHTRHSHLIRKKINNNHNNNNNKGRLNELRLPMLATVSNTLSHAIGIN